VSGVAVLVDASAHTQLQSPASHASTTSSQPGISTVEQSTSDDVVVDPVPELALPPESPLGPPSSPHAHGRAMTESIKNARSMPTARVPRVAAASALARGSADEILHCARHRFVDGREMNWDRAADALLHVLAP
jgi:hypothetical protein